MADAALSLMLQRADSSIRSQIALVRSARSLREVALNMTPRAAGIVPSMVRTLPAARSLEQEANRQAENLVDTQLKSLSELPPSQQEAQIAHLRAREWVHLRGNFPRLARKVEDAVIRLRKQRSEE